MPHDLYGNYYPSERDAMNAEMVQCAAIDASLAARDLRLLGESVRDNDLADQRWKDQMEDRLKLIERVLGISAEPEAGNG